VISCSCYITTPTKTATVVASTTTSTTTIRVTITTTVPGRLLAQYTSAVYNKLYGHYDNLCTLVGNSDNWLVEFGPQNHCYVTNASPDSTYPGSEAYVDALNACVNTGKFEGTVTFVYSSNLNEWLCYTRLPFNFND
jgi:hypothetical protein